MKNSLAPRRSLSISHVIYYRRAVLDFGLDGFDAAPKLAPDPVAAPEAKGVEKSEPPVLVPNGEAELLNREGVEEGPNKEDDEELKAAAWGVALDEPNKEDTGAEVVGVVNIDGVEEGGTEDGVLNSENPLPDDDNVVAADVCEAVNVP